MTLMALFGVTIIGFVLALMPFAIPITLMVVGLHFAIKWW